MANPVFLDLDSVKPDVDFSIKLKGETHALAPTTVDGFIEQVQMLETLGRQSNTVEELKIVKTLLSRAFPTVGENEWGAMPLFALRQLNETVMMLGGHEEVKDEAEKEAEANPQKAALEA